MYFVFGNMFNLELVSQETTWKHLPKQRKLNNEEVSKIQELMSVDGNKKVIQQKIIQETNKIVTLKDITNIAARERQGKTRNSIETFVGELRNKYGNIMPNIHSF